MNLEKIINNSKKIIRNSVVSASLALLLLSTTCKKPTEVEEDKPKTVTQQINPSVDNTIKLDEYELFIPKGALDSPATVTLSVPDFSFTFRDSTSTDEIQVDMNRLIQDTVFVKFPNPATSIPNGVGIIYDRINSFYSLSDGRVEKEKAVVPFFSNQAANLKKSASGGITSSSIISYHPIPTECFQKVDLIGDVSNITNSNGKVAILIHGLSSSPETFKQIGPTGISFFEEINNRYNNRVLLFQYPSGENISKNADSLRFRLEKISLQNPNIHFDIYAHSMGGLVSRKILLYNPEKIDNLITLGSPHNGAGNNDSPFLGNLDDYLAEADPGAEVRSFLFGSTTDGGKDLRFQSPFIYDLNHNHNIEISTRYLTIAGTKERIWSVGGELDDGVVLVKSANMLDPFFPMTREKPSSLESMLVNLSHTDLPKGSQEIFNRIDDFLNIPTTTRIELKNDDGTVDSSYALRGYCDPNFANYEGIGIFGVRSTFTPPKYPFHLEKIKIHLSGKPSFSDSYSVQFTGIRGYVWLNTDEVTVPGWWEVDLSSFTNTDIYSGDISIEVLRRFYPDQNCLDISKYLRISYDSSSRGNSEYFDTAIPQHLIPLPGEFLIRAVGTVPK